MTAEKVSLKNTRNYAELDVELGNGVNVFYGENAQGKTNFLEAVYFCATGRSHRTNNDKELIKFGEDEAHLRVCVKNSAGMTERVDAHVKQTGKGIAVNGMPIKRLSELFGALLVVIFSPEDLTLVKAGPGERRRYIDMELCQLSAVYCHALTSYHKALKQRNALLKEIQKDKNRADELYVWNEQLIIPAEKIIKSRENFVKKLSAAACIIHAEITSGKEKLEIIYKPDVTPDEFYDKLSKNVQRDLIAGTTTRGVHKDEAVFMINGTNARIYGSQGQQRTASLSAKLAEIDVMEEEKRTTPVLLLDDVFSELDEGRAGRLISRVKNAQTIITCAGVEGVVNKLGADVKMFNVVNGEIKDWDT